MTILLAVTLLAVLMFAGVPVGVSMGLAGAAGLWLFGGPEAVWGVLSTTPYRQSASWLLVALPLFVLMAEFLSGANVSRQLFRAAHLWLGRIPGSLAVTTVVSTALFGAISGSSSAATATMAKTAIPEMRRHRYDDRLSLGTVAGVGSIAMLIPPSVVLIIYGILTEVSIGDLFLAAIVPGILTTIVYVGVVVVWVKFRPGIVAATPATVGSGSALPVPSDEPAYGTSVESRTVSWAQRINALKEFGPILVLFVAVMGGIYSGLATVTEAAAVGATGALLIALFRKALDRSQFFHALGETAKTTGMIFMIIIGAHVFGYFLALTRATDALIAFVGDLPLAPRAIMACILALYLVLGFVMDQLAVLVLTVPLVFPVVVDLGFDPVWFGILVIKTVEIGLATPPLGLNVFIASSVSGVATGAGFRGVARFVFADLALLALLALVPAIVLVLV